MLSNKSQKSKVVSIWNVLKGTSPFIQLRKYCKYESELSTIIHNKIDEKHYLNLNQQQIVALTELHHYIASHKLQQKQIDITNILLTMNQRITNHIEKCYDRLQN